MSKIDEERLYRLRNNLEVELPQVVIYTDIEGEYLHIIYNGKSVCKILTQKQGGFSIEFEREFVFDNHPSITWRSTFSGVESCISSRIRYYDTKKGQKNMMTLGDLKDYIQRELGNLVAAVYESGKTGPGPNSDRIRVNHGGCWVCSIYRCKSNDDLFTVIFYDPFICRSRGYSSVVDLTVGEVPRSIKNRINICEVDSGKCTVNDQDSMVDKILSQYKGGFTYATVHGDGRDFRHMHPIMRTGRINITIDSFIKDVIFNNPATIVFWTDGSKTVVKCQPGETFDPEKGLAMAISKKVLGNDYGYYEAFAKYVGRYNKKHKEK